MVRGTRRKALRSGWCRAMALRGPTPSRKRCLGEPTPKRAPKRGRAPGAASSRRSQSGATSTSLLIRATNSAPASRARRIASLLARPNPRFSGNSRCSTSGNQSESSSRVPSSDPLSATTRWSRAGASCLRSASRASANRCAPFQVRTTACTSGRCATPSGPLLDVGINAAPLAAARTAVRRYIAGLLGALDAAKPDGVRARPLFLPSAPARGLRGFVKRLPFAYPLADAARSAVLRRERPTVYHETNHAPPTFHRPLRVTVHDLSTLLHPRTQEPARVRYFARRLPRNGSAPRVLVPTDAIAEEVVQHLGVPLDRLRGIHHGIDAHC